MAQAQAAETVAVVSPEMAAINNDILQRVLGPRYARLRTREDRLAFHRNTIKALAHVTRHVLEEVPEEADTLKAEHDKVLADGLE